MFESTPREALESVILIKTNEGQGSAVVFEHQGETLVATAAHVLGKGRTTEVKVYEQGRFTERRGAVLHKTGDGPEESDIAVLQLRPEPSGGSGWATGTANVGIAHAVPGRPLQVLGFPGGRWASQREEDTGGLIPTALVQGGVVGGAETNGRPRRLYIGAQLFPGFSGGAVITEGADGKANLAAIVTRVMDLNSHGWDGKYAGFGQGTAFDDVIELIEGDPARVNQLVWTEEISDESGSREEGGSDRDEEATREQTNEDERRRTLVETEREGGKPMRNARHVVPHRDGWAILKPDADRASSIHRRQADAVDRAREILRNDGGGELITHGIDGRMRDADTVHPGGDPRHREG